MSGDEISDIEENIEFTQNELRAIHAGRKIEAIKLVRESKKLGLKEAKQTVEKYINDNPHFVQKRTSSGGLGVVLFIVPVLAIIYFLNSKYGFW